MNNEDYLYVDKENRLKEINKIENFIKALCTIYLNLMKRIK